jgi:hypothetical protein
MLISILPPALVTQGYITSANIHSSLSPLPQKGQDHNVYTSNQIYPTQSSIAIHSNNLELIVSGHTVTTWILPLSGESIDFYFKAQVNSLNKPNLENLAKILCDNSETMAYKHSCVPDSKSIPSVKYFVQGF